MEKWKRNNRKPGSRTDITRWLDGSDEGLKEFDCPVIVKGTAKPGGLKARTCRPSRFCWLSSRELRCPWCQTAMKWEALCYPTLQAVTNTQKYTSTHGHIQCIKLLLRHVFFPSLRCDVYRNYLYRVNWFESDWTVKNSIKMKYLFLHRSFTC